GASPAVAARARAAGRGAGLEPGRVGAAAGGSAARPLDVLGGLARGQRLSKEAHQVLAPDPAAARHEPTVSALRPLAEGGIDLDLVEPALAAQRLADDQ